MISLGFGICRNDIGGELFYDVPGSEVHFLFLNAELPGGCLPHVDSRIFQRTWTVTGLSRRGRDGVHFKIFPWRRTGRLPGRSRRCAFPSAWGPGRVPLPGKWIYRESGFHHGIGCRINGLGRSRVGIQLFPLLLPGVAAGVSGVEGTLKFRALVNVLGSLPKTM